MKTPAKSDIVDALVADWRREDIRLRPEAMQVVGRIIRLGRLYYDHVSALLRPHGLSYSDFDVLATLRRSGRPYELAPTELQQSVLLTSGAMTACLHRLEEAGLITRRADANDGRRSRARLSKRGQGLVERLISQRFELAQDALSGLTLKEADALVALLRRLDRSAD